MYYVNRVIVVAVARGIVEHLQPSLLCEHGGPVDLGRKWAESMMRLRDTTAAATLSLLCLSNHIHNVDRSTILFMGTWP